MSTANDGARRRQRRERVPYDPTIEYTPQQLDRFRRSAKNSALWYLSRADRSRKEIEDRLRKRGDLPPEIIQETLTLLEGHHLLDDTRYAETLVRRGMGSRKLGSRRIQQDMRQRGVPAEIIEEALAQIDPNDEETNARTFLVRRGRSVKEAAWADPYKVRAALVGAMARRGYSGQLVYRLVNEYVQRHEAGEFAAGEEPLDF